MSADLKTVLFNALENDGDFKECELDADGDFTAAHSCCGCSVNIYLDPIETAVRDHFFDREKVRAALIHACNHDCLNPWQLEEDAVDRLIAGLSGGSE